jgi:hypothetical protein
MAFKKKMEETCKSEERALQLVASGYFATTKELFLQSLSTCAKVAIVSQVIVSLLILLFLYNSIF